MATLSVIYEKYKKIVEDLFPQGKAWELVRSSTSNLNKLVCIIASETQRLDGRIKDLLDEANCNKTFEMLEDWENFLGIPDECTPADEDLTLFERRKRVCQKLTTGGGQNAAFYKLIAEQLGYDIDVIDVIDFRDFRVGQSRVGDRLYNGSNPATGWDFAFGIRAPATLTRFFRVGESTVGQRLVLVNNEELECIIKKFAPAHVTVLFSFTGDL